MKKMKKNENEKHESSLTTIEERIIFLVGGLCNLVTTGMFTQALVRWRSKHSEYFKKPEILIRVFKLLEGPCRLKQRRFIHELFSDVVLDDVFKLLDPQI